jgi:predicted enzyme related to lactoylglutathione lyase
MRVLMVLDCVDADALADFWAAALGFSRGKFHPPYVRLVDRRGKWPDLLLQQVPEAKCSKNRMHLDIQVKNLQPELARLTELGARVIVPTHDDAGFLTTVLADPQGNEFCLIVPPTDGYDWGQLGGEG